MPSDSTSKIRDGLVRTSLILLGCALLFFAFLSLQWRFQHDTALLFYISFLIEHFGYIPYRDIFDVNLPATYLIYAVIGRITDYSDAGIRFADLTLLAGLIWMMWRWMRGLGRTVAWAGAVVFGLIYLRLGPAVSLQREFLVLLPVMGGILIFTGSLRWKPWIRFALSGLFFGIAALIKPQAAVGLPILLGFELISRKAECRSVVQQSILPTLSGFLVPLLVAVMYLLQTDAFQPFMSIVRNYYPLYAQLTGEHSILPEGERLAYLAGGYFRFGGFGWWWVPVLMGVFVSLRAAGEHRRKTLFLLALLLGYSFYPLFSGKFWHYHWLPFVFFATQVSALCLVERKEGVSVMGRLLPVGIFLSFAFFTATPTAFLLDQIRRGEPQPIKGGRVDEIAGYLRAELRPGDSVQPLDWTGGVAHAMLLARAKPATRFVYDVTFYHHVSSEYTQGLRREFVSQLELSKSRFVIEVFGEDKQWVNGEGTSREFGELRSLIETNYQVVVRGNGYEIHRASHSEP